MAYTFKHGDRPLEGVTIQRAVGRGGFGEVYYAKTDSGKEIALKYLRENPEVELRGVAQVMNLKSPHLITIYDVRRNGEGDPFVMMEYVSGPSLHELMTAEPKGLGPQKAAFFLNGIAKGLSYLHDRGIVHRDLKPGNIFYDEGYVKIGDYGLSKHLSMSRHSGNTVSVGTVHYMAPEIGSGSYTKAIDIYALGVILYEMLTGRLPFTGSSMAEILMRHLQDRPDVGAIPEPFKSVIVRALQKNPLDRYQDVNEMVDAIMSSTEVTAGFNSFDPSVLASNYQRGAAAEEMDRTVTTPPRRAPVPALDVHGAVPFPAATADVIPDIPPLPDEARPMRRQPGAAPHGAAPYAAAPAGIGTWLADSARNARLRWPVALSFGVILLAAAGLAGSVDRARDAAPISIGWFLLSGTFAALFAQLSVIPRAPEQNPFVERIMTASIAGAMMIPGALIGGGDNVAFAIPILATLAINNWHERVAQGRRGEVRIWSAAGPAFVGFLAALPFARRDDEMKLAFAVSGAALSLLVQLGASIWAMPRPAAARAPAGGRPIPPIPPMAAPASPVPPQSPRAVAESGGSAGPFPGMPAGARGISVRLTSFQGVPSWIQPRPAGALVPQGLRVIWAVLLCLAVAGAVAGFVARGVAARSVDDKVGTMALGFGGVALCIFFAVKLGQKHRRTLIGGTIRPFVLSFAVFIIGLMIAILSSDPRLDGEEIAGCVFGMVAAAGIAVVSLAFRWERGERQAQPVMEAAPPPQPAAPAEPAAAPSFVGRATNAGLSFLGKMLLVASLAMAVLYNMRGVSFEGANAVVSANNGRVEIVNRHGEFIEAQVPRAAVLGPLLFGTILLMVSRRADGGMHFLRGLAGCGLGLVAVVLCLGPAANAISILLTERDWEDMARMTNSSPLIVAGLAGFGSLGLLLWPKRLGGRTIVI